MLRKLFIDKILLYLFLVLMTGMFLFDKKFSQLNIKIGVLPVYVTEIFLIVASILLIIYFICTKDPKRIIFLDQKIEFLSLLFIFVISLIIGLLNYDIIFTLRQSAIIYYSIFYFIVPIIFDNFKKIKAYLIILFISACILTIINMVNIRIDGLGYYGYFYIAMALILLILNIYIIKRRLYKYILYIVMSLFLTAIILSEKRAIWVGVLLAVFSIIIIFLMIPSLRINIKRVIILILILMICTTLILSMIYFLSRERVSEIKDEVTTVYSFKDVNNTPANNIKWRISAWKDFLDESLKSPLLGYGFGRAYMSPILLEQGWVPPEKEDWMDPHNSYISILFRTGFIGLLIFLIIIIRFFVIAIRYTRKCDNEKEKYLIVGLLAIIVFILSSSFFMVSFENPYFGIFLWINMGFVVSMIKSKRNKECLN